MHNFNFKEKRKNEARIFVLKMNLVNQGNFQKNGRSRIGNKSLKSNINWPTGGALCPKLSFVYSSSPTNSP